MVPHVRPTRPHGTPRGRGQHSTSRQCAGSGGGLRRVAALLAVLAALTLSAGCSGVGDSDSASGGADGAAADRAAPDDAGGRAGSLADSDSADSESAESGQDSASADDGPLLQEPAIVSTGTVTVSAADLDAVDRDLDEIVASHRGRTTSEESSTDTDGEVDYAQRVIRVPSADFAAVVRELKGLSDEVEVKTDSDDVTTEVVDTDARVRAQERALQRMELLLDRAESLKDIISVESELTRRQADLDALKSQQAYLADQTSMSTLTVFLRRLDSSPEPETDEDHNAFVGGLLGGWEAMAGVGAGLAAVLGALLPFFVVLALIAAACWAVLRLTRPARTRAAQRRREAREQAARRQPAHPQPPPSGPAGPVPAGPGEVTPPASSSARSR